MVTCPVPHCQEPTRLFPLCEPHWFAAPHAMRQMYNMGVYPLEIIIDKVRLDEMLQTVPLYKFKVL